MHAMMCRPYSPVTGTSVSCAIALAIACHSLITAFCIHWGSRVEVTDPARLAVLTQTTLSVDDTRDVLEALRRRFPAVQLPRKDDICYATQNRQNAVKAMIGAVDLLLVVGAPESSNSNRLVEIARKAGVPAQLVQTSAEIRPEWVLGAACVGVTAGASAPEVLVEAVIERLRALAGGDVQVQTQPGEPEGVVFQLPPELRVASDPSLR